MIISRISALEAAVGWAVVGIVLIFLNSLLMTLSEIYVLVLALCILESSNHLTLRFRAVLWRGRSVSPAHQMGFQEDSLSHTKLAVLVGRFDQFRHVCQAPS
jgi:hypothetical protein